MFMFLQGNKQCWIGTLKPFSSPFHLRSPIKLRCIAQISAIFQDFVSCSGLHLSGPGEIRLLKVFFYNFPIVQNIYNLLWSCGLVPWLQLDLERFDCSKLKLFNFFFKLSHAANDLAIFCDIVLWLHLDLSIIGKKLHEDENLILRPSPAIAISFFCCNVPCSTMGWSWWSS